MRANSRTTIGGMHLQRRPALRAEYRLDIPAPHRIKKWLTMAAVLAGVALVGVGAYVYSGRYNIAADQPHWLVTSKMIEALRNRSIESRARDIVIPDLEDSRLVIKGAAQYDAMCSGCHLSPGVEDSEIRQGLYP